MATVETVTVLFTDLVGSTSLESRVGPAKADELRREHFSLLADALEESEGGREVKNTGDGLMAVFPSAAGATDCAVSIQQRFERRNRDAEEQLAVKIGTAMGDATREGDDYFGMPAILAARLCAAAAGGQILVAELVKMMVGGRGDQTFTSVGALELKGIPEPMETYEVGWEPIGRERPAIPLPQLLSGVPAIGYVGRQAERDQLATDWAAARDGERRTVLLSGEPGIGKTRLASYLALEAHAAGGVVLCGRCVEDLGAPYGPFIDALSHLVEHAPDQLLREHIERHGSELSRLVPGLTTRVVDAPPLRESDPDTERYLLLGAATGLLEAASEHDPLILLLDDLHWADKPTVLLLKHLTSSANPARLLVIGTFRDSDVGRGHPLSELLADMHRAEGVERIALKGLGEADVVAIMEAAAGHEMDEVGLRLAGQIASDTDGNPFFVAELLRHLTESGALAQRDDGRWELAGGAEDGIGLPQSVREVIGTRIERLGDAVERQLRVAAVVGREFDVELLVRLADTDEDELLDALEAAEAASVLVESGERAGRYSFAHALINQTLYDELGATRRARLHKRVAEALEEICGDDPGARLTELAHHWSAATVAVESNKALDYSRRAAERALGELAPDEAMRWFAHALELDDQRPGKDPEMRCDLLTGLGEAQRQAGQAEHRSTLLEAGRLAREMGDPDRLARAATANTRGYTSEIGLVDDDRAEMLRSAIDVLPEGDPRQARLRSLLAMELHYGATLEERSELTERALEGVRAADDPSLLAHALIDSFFAIWHPSTSARRREATEELQELSEQLDDPLIEYWAAGLMFHITAEAADGDGLDRSLARMRELADSLGEPFAHWFVTWLAAARAHTEGHLERSEELIEEAVAFAMEHGQGDAMIVYVAQLCTLRREQGRMDEIEDVLAQSREDNPGLPAFSAALALAYLEMGRDEEAGALLEEAAKDGFAGLGKDVVWISGLMMYGEISARLSVRQAAATARDLLEPFAGQIAWNGASIWGAVSSVLGLLSAALGEHERADAHYAEGIEGLERLRSSFDLCRTRLWWAESLLERGEQARARALLEEVIADSRELGAPSLEARGSELLGVLA